MIKWDVFIKKMLELYPDRANPGVLWGSAHAAREKTRRL